MKFKFDDGGREAAGFKGTTGDCVTRAIAIATGKPYREVYDEINGLMKSKRQTKKMRGASARAGVPKHIDREYLLSLGWTWTPTMDIGQGCKVHLDERELPSGTVICQVSKHLTTVIDGVIHDTHDPSRAGSRCVYGYYQKHT